MIACAGVLGWWLFYNPADDITPSLPGQDNRPEKDTTQTETIIIGEKFKEYIQFSSDLTGKWTRFRGADFDNIVKDNIRLIDSWGEDGPEILWEVELGEGHAAPAIYNGRVYILDYLEIKKADALRCFSLETGEEIWRRWYNVHVKRNHGMSRTVPAVNDKYIVTVGPRGHVMCCEPDNGEFLWGMDLVKDFGSEIPFWYTGQCPIIDDTVVVLAPAGSSLLVGVNCANGEIIWQTPNKDGWRMSHSSIMPMQYGGKKMYIYAAIGGICGVSAEGNNIGEILWRTTAFAPSVVAPSPLVLEDGKILITAGYGAGAMFFQLKKEGDKILVDIIQTYKPIEGISSEQQTPIYHLGRIFSILPKDAGPKRNQFICGDPNDCTNIYWSSGKTERFGLGPYVVADGKFFILSDDGTLAIVRASAESFILLDKARIIEGQDAWGPIAIADGRLLMRDSKKMVCLDVQAN